MYRNGGRQFSRGTTGGPEPPRRRKFRGQYVRRRTPSDYQYRAGSFSDERNDSSPPPHQNPRPTEESSYAGPHYAQRMQRQRRGMRYYERHLNDNHYQQRQHRNTQSRNQDLSDNEYQEHHTNDQQPPSTSSHRETIVDRFERAERNDRATDRAERTDRSERNHGPNSSGQSRAVEELSKSFNGVKLDVDELKTMFKEMKNVVDQIKMRLAELESNPSKGTNHQLATSNSKEAIELDQNEKEKRRKAKILKQRERKALKLAQKNVSVANDAKQQPDPGQSEQQAQQTTILNPEPTTSVDKSSEQVNNHDSKNVEQQQSTGPTIAKYDRRTNRERITDKARPRREFKEKSHKPLPKVNRNNINDDSTTQAAEPSSEDRPEGDDGRDTAGKERVRVYRRKKQHFGRRGAYNNRRRRADSSERNSNDTSPQNEANGTCDSQENKENNRNSFPELDESELNDVVQTLKREFLNLERPLKAIKGTMNMKGPKVVYEFAVSILDHAICDVTSPTKLSEIANSLYQLLVSDDNNSEVDFQEGFYEALNDISKREDDLAIDAPRYMDTLGQVLADCVVPMFCKHKSLVKKFLNRSIESYCKHNRAVLLASVMKCIAGVEDERLAKDIWDMAQFNWVNFLDESTSLTEFLEHHDVAFTTKTFSQETRSSKNMPKELEKFADDVTEFVEKRCTPQVLEDLVKELNIDQDEQVSYLGTFIYAIVRGCLITDSGVYKLNNEALSEYSSILRKKHENQEKIALYALTALTKLWHQYNCPQDLFRTIMLALYNQGAAPYTALQDWLNSENLNNIPGIGAARLNSKRCIEDLGANLKS